MKSSGFLQVSHQQSERRRALRFLLVCLACSVFVGCAARPVGVLAPAPAAIPGAIHLDLLVATNRAPSPDRGVLFSGERGEASLKSFVVSIPPDTRREIGRVQWPRSVPPDPASEFATLDVVSLDSAGQTEKWLQAHKSPSRRVLVFVHGFNTSFESALFRFAQIVHDSGADATPVLFTWPSRGSVFEYSYDRESANFSRDALEKLLKRLSESSNVSEITVLAHSMGGWLAIESLRQMAIREGRVRDKIQTVILAAPDLDVDVFRTQLRSFGDHRPRFTVFVSREDHALRLSRSIAGDVERLGRIDPDAKPWIAEDGVEIIDLTGKESVSLLRHSKFSENPQVIRYLGTQLINGKGAADDQAGIGERLGGVSMGVARGMADAAGLATSAPTAILDPNMRRAYSEQVSQFWRAIDNAIASGVDWR
jgi:esterase/lipase superfamily enzyme